MKILLQELFFAKQVNYKDAFFFNVKQTKYKMITFGMITSVFILKDWLETYKNKKDNYINHPTSNPPDCNSSSVVNSQSSLSRFGGVGRPSSFINTPGFIEIFCEFN